MRWTRFILLLLFLSLLGWLAGGLRLPSNRCWLIHPKVVL